MVEDKFVTTGYAALDRLVDEFNAPKLILVTHNNKKEFLSDITTFVSVSGKIPMAIFSLELKIEDAIHNLIYSSAHINTDRDDSKNFDTKEWHNISNAMGLFTEAPIVISDNTTFLSDIEDLTNKFRKEYTDTRAMVVIDNLQLIDIAEDWDHKGKLESIICRLEGLSRSTNSIILLLTNHAHKDSRFLDRISTWVCL